MKGRRIHRINSLLKEVISEVIHRSVKNPHIDTFVTVTSVQTSADLHHAKVFVSLLASDEAKKKVLDALTTAAGFIAVNAAKKVELRYFPELTFHLDSSAEEYLKIEKILSQIKEEKKESPEKIPHE